MSCRAPLLCALCAVLVPRLAFGSLVVGATRVEDDSIEVDGEATDPGWRNAHWYENFVQRDPKEGAAPSEATRVAFAYDSEAIFVFVRAEDRDAQRIFAAVTRRDRSSPSDWVEVWLAPQRDRRTGYRFSVNAAGVQMDAQLGEGGENQDFEWNGVWTSRVSRDDKGWSAEIRIPFSELRCEATSSWGINVSRRIQRLNEESVLSPTPKMSPRVLGYAAELKGIKGISETTPISLLPYGVLGWQHEANDGSYVLRVGGDLRIGLGPASTLEASILPDYGQVEADPSQLNLTAFEVFLPEKRPFFLEGRDTLRFPLSFRNWDNETIYYSRRIGQQPTRDLSVSDTASVDYPKQSRILAAAKWLGSTKGGLSVAALSAMTEAEYATVTDGGITTRPLVAPATSYTVLRVRRDFDRGRSAFGGMATHVERFIQGGDRSLFVTRASAGAADFDWRHGNLGVVGNAFGTHLEGDSQAIDAVQRSSTHYMQRPDAPRLHYDPTRTSLNGWGAELYGGKFDGTPIRGGWGVRARSPGLNPNDMGYMRRADIQFAEAWLDWHLDRPTAHYRSLSLGVNTWLTKTFGPEVTSQGISTWLYSRLRSNMVTWMGASRAREALDVSLLRGGPAFLVPGSWDGYWGFQSDDRERTDVNLSGSFSWRDNRSYKRLGVTLTLRTRPTSALTVSLAPRYERSLDDMQYVNGDDPNAIVLGRLTRTTGSLTLRLNWALSPDLSLESYAMPYVSAGTYSQFYRVVAPRAHDYSDRRVPTAYAGDDRFVVGQVRSNVVLRWDYAPGASIYAVWAHEQTSDRNDIGRFLPFTDAYDLLKATSNDTLMLKLTMLERL